MPSPFPGMNPFIENPDCWKDFHQYFMTFMGEALNAQLNPRYVVRVEEHLYLHELPDESRRLFARADIAVKPGVDPRPFEASLAVLEAPAQGMLPSEDIERLTRLEVRDRQSRQVVTVIELLSPTNKNPGADRDQYVGKRAVLLHSPVHFVEIDLLRGGPRMPVEGVPACAYLLMVSRAEQRPHTGLWPLQLRESLPQIPVPLRQPDPDARIQLQALVHRVYDAAGFKSYIYDLVPEPPLGSDDLAWARQFIAAP
jgi:hypothetical protein